MEDLNVTQVSELDNEIQDQLIDSDVEILEEVEKELTEEEKREALREYIKKQKESNHNHHPIKHLGNITTNNFGAKYKKKRAQKNKAQRKSRVKNR